MDTLNNSVDMGVMRNLHDNVPLADNKMLGFTLRDMLLECEFKDEPCDFRLEIPFLFPWIHHLCGWGFKRRQNSVATFWLFSFRTFTCYEQHDCYSYELCCPSIFIARKYIYKKDFRITKLSPLLYLFAVTLHIFQTSSTAIATRSMPTNRTWRVRGSMKAVHTKVCSPIHLG